MTDEPFDDMMKEAREWANMKAELRNILAENGFEVLPSEINDAVKAIAYSKDERLTLGNLLRRVLGQENYQKFLNKGR